MSNPKPGLNSVTLEVANVISSFEIDTKTNTVARFFALLEGYTKYFKKENKESLGIVKGRPKIIVSYSLGNSQFTDTFASEELLVNFVKDKFLKRASRIQEERRIAAANRRAERMKEETGGEVQRPASSQAQTRDARRHIPYAPGSRGRRM